MTIILWSPSYLKCNTHVLRWWIILLDKYYSNESLGRGDSKSPFKRTAHFVHIVRDLYARITIMYITRITRVVITSGMWFVLCRYTFCGLILTLILMFTGCWPNRYYSRVWCVPREIYKTFCAAAYTVQNIIIIIIV